MPALPAIEADRRWFDGRRWFSRRIAWFALASVAVLIAGVFFAYSLVSVPSASETARIRAGLEEATGLDIALHGPVELRLWPRPMVVAHDVTVSGLGGAVTMQVGAARGLLALPDLVRGRTVLASLALSDVTGTIDADAAGERFAEVNAESSATPDGPDQMLRPGALALLGASIQIRSSHAALNGFIGDLNAAFEGLRGGAGAFSAHASWHGERADLSGRLDSIVSFLKGSAASGSVHVKSHAVSASLSGTWMEGWRGGFKGNVTAATPSLPALMRLGGLQPGAFTGIERVSFSGSAVPGPDGPAFDSVRLVINDDSLEGTLGLQSQAGRWMLAGTLATDRLDLSSFSAVLPAMWQDGEWSEKPIPLAPRDLQDLDLRLSVGRLQVGRFHADDAALSFLCNDGRMELSLGEARAYGGMVKARLFAAGEASALTLKGDVSWAQLDVSRLAKAAVETGASEWAGLSSGSVTAEGSGGHARALVASLQAKGQATWQQGRVGASSAVALLFGPTGLQTATAPVSFDLATAAFTLKDGVAEIGSASVSGEDGSHALRGQMSLAQQTYSVWTQPIAPEGESVGSAEGASGSRGIRGSWKGHPHVFRPSPTLSDPAPPYAPDTSAPVAHD